MSDSKVEKNELLDTIHHPSNTIIVSLRDIVNKVVDEDLNKEALDLGLEDNKLIKD
ncbi:hypothetical protein H4Q26_007533 [Puccinia striiformis f. sp. tritici PST-130]|nr:hypothetical protein H4Q26_007533 [Puccinia striiformis f. sp. tritici PST-130]